MVTLDITALRSFVAVTAFGGVRRAAEALTLSPASISSHIRRLERELGCRLVMAQGRGIGLTIDGEELATRARVILQEHDDAVRALRGPRDDTLVVAITELAAEFLAPSIISSLQATLPAFDARLRFGRSDRIRQFVDDGRADVALRLTHASPGAAAISAVSLKWFGSATAPRDRIVLFAPPCAVREHAVVSLKSHPHEVVKNGTDLLCVLTAARDDVGVTPLPSTLAVTDGLSHVEDLPPIPDVHLCMSTGARIGRRTRATLVEAVRAVLAGSGPN